jgi:hypothetical protein
MMRTAWLGLAFALCLAPAAGAGEFVVVSSTDPAFRPGQELAGGYSVQLASGAQLVVVHASGMVRRLIGGPQAVRLPEVAAASANARRTEVLKLMVAQPRRTRSLVPPACPAPETLTTLDAILAAGEQEACLPLARQALSDYAERAAE